MKSRRLTIDSVVLERVNRALDAIRSGKMTILVDDEDRENEGDLCMAAELVTPEAINFMATHGRGLICLTLDEEQIDRLDLPMMSVRGRRSPGLGTAFTVSIEAAEGVTTGISAADRAHTVRVAINPNVKPTDVVIPGHVFPLRARRGGVLVRTGQTEGSVDLARLAGLRPCGVICEIMREDGTMARLPDLETFASKHGLCILSIADLIQYRLQTEQLVRCLGRKRLRLDATESEWLAVGYEVAVESRQAIALVKGDLSGSKPVLCRVHSGSLIADLFSSTRTEGGAHLREAIRRIEDEKRGVVLYLPSQRTLGEELSSWQDAGGVPRAADSVSSLSELEMESRGQSRQILRKFGLGAQMLADLGVRKLRLLSNSERKIAGLTGYGLEVVERVPLESGEQSHPGEKKHG